MTTSGTYTFNPSLGELVLSAYARCGIRRTALVQEHMQDARYEMNYMLADWSLNGVNLWKVDVQTVPLIAGQTTYTVPSNTIMILDAYIATGSGQSEFDRIILPISRTEYAQVPNKNLEGASTSFWFDRLINPTITLWPVPNQDNYYTLKYYRVLQIEDAEYENAQTVDIPYRWLNAAVAGLAVRLAAIYAPERVPLLEPKAIQAYAAASMQDTENVPLYIMPGLAGYYRV